MVNTDEAAYDKASTVFLANLSSSTDDEFFKHLFRAIGEVKAFVRLSDPISKQRASTARVIFHGALLAKWAVTALNGSMIDNHEIIAKADDRININADEDLITRATEIARELAAEKNGKKYNNRYNPLPKVLPRNFPPVVQAHELDPIIVERLKTDALISITRKERDMQTRIHDILLKRANQKGYSIKSNSQILDTRPNTSNDTSNGEHQNNHFTTTEDSQGNSTAAAAMKQAENWNLSIEAKDVYKKYIIDQYRHSKREETEGVIALSNNYVVSGRERRRLEFVIDVQKHVDQRIELMAKDLKEDIFNWESTANKKRESMKENSKERRWILSASLRELEDLDLDVRPIEKSAGGRSLRAAKRAKEIEDDMQLRSEVFEMKKRKKEEKTLIVAKNILESIPDDEKTLFSIVLSKSHILRSQDKVKQWLQKKLADILGDNAEELTDILIDELTSTTGTPQSVIDILSLALGSNTSSFVSKLWKMLIFEQRFYELSSRK